MTIAPPTTEVLLADLNLPSAPPVVRAGAPPVPRRKAGPWVLVVVGALLVVGPVVGGLFVKVASGQQMIDAFAPHLTDDALAKYDDDLAVLRTGEAALAHTYRTRQVPAGKYPGAESYVADATAIDARATALLTRIRAAQPDYEAVAGVSGFDRAPFLLVAAGLTLTYAGVVLLRGSRQRSGGALALAAVAAAALVAYPFLSDLPHGTRAGDRLQEALAPVMRAETVRAQQDDFVVLVHAVGELDTSFRDQPRSAADGRQLDALVQAWPTVSSDLATLVGAINDNITNYQALADLDGLTDPLGFSGLVALPWYLVGTGALCAVAAAASRPRKAPSPTLSRKDLP